MNPVLVVMLKAFDRVSSDAAVLIFLMPLGSFNPSPLCHLVHSPSEVLQKTTELRELL